ncbi:MAG: prefoldin subunit alpha [Candidatus Methanomethylophilaceae archaeon]|jgi:prefoldin alpha subunit
MNDDELRQAMSTLDAYKEQLDAMAQQSQLLQLSLEEAMRARDTLKALNNAKEGDEILVPAGASSFVTAKLTSKKTALVNIGNRTSVEKSFDEAINYMTSNIDEITEALKRITDTMNKMNNNARGLAAAIQQEYQRRQQ